MTITYDPTLVMLAIFVAITGAVTGLTLTVGFDQRYGYNSALSLLKGAIMMGLAVWATHFVALLAVRFPVSVGYSFVETMVSLYVAIIGASLALFVARGQYLGPLSCVVGGILMGGAVAGMHFMGMKAMRGCGLEQTGEGVVAAITIAVVVSMVGLWFAFRRPGITGTLIGGAMLGVGIPAVHLTALGSTTFTYSYAAHTLAAPLLTEEVLSFLVASATIGICGLFLLLFAKLTLGGLEERRAITGPVHQGRSLNDFHHM